MPLNQPTDIQQFTLIFKLYLFGYDTNYRAIL